NSRPANAGVTSVSIAGTGFQSGATVSSSNTAVATVGTPSAVTSTSITVAVNPVASRTTTLKLTNPDAGTATSGTFTVNAAPTVIGLTPSQRGGNATPVNVTIGGTGFQTGAGVISTNTGVATISNVSVASGTAIGLLLTPVGVGTTSFTVT